MLKWREKNQRSGEQTFISPRPIPGIAIYSQKDSHTYRYRGKYFLLTSYIIALLIIINKNYITLLFLKNIIPFTTQRQ